MNFYSNLSVMQCDFAESCVLVKIFSPSNARRFSCFLTLNFKRRCLTILRCLLCGQPLRTQTLILDFLALSISPSHWHQHWTRGLLSLSHLISGWWSLKGDLSLSPAAFVLMSLSQCHASYHWCHASCDCNGLFWWCLWYQPYFLKERQGLFHMVTYSTI